MTHVNRLSEIIEQKKKNSLKSVTVSGILQKHALKNINLLNCYAAR